MDPTLRGPRSICSIEGEADVVGGADTEGAEATSQATEGANGQTGQDISAIAAAVAATVMESVTQIIAPLQERVNAMPTAATISDSINASVRRATKSKGAPPSTTDADAGTQSSQGDDVGDSDAGPSEIQMLRAELRFEKDFGRATRGLALSEREESVLLVLAETEKPPNLSTWVATTVKDLGFGKSSSPGTETESTEGSAQAADAGTDVSGAAVSDGGSPNAPNVPLDEISDPRKLGSGDNWKRLVTKHGLPGAQKKLRAVAETWLKTQRIVAPKQQYTG